jgi:hypothetical protein
LATSSKRAWRAAAGDCDTPGEIERSTNGGTTWKRIIRSGPAPIVRLGSRPSGNLFTIGGTGHNCSTHYEVYANDGKIVASSTSPVDLWFPTPKNRDEINGPGRTKATPCQRHVIGLASLNSSQALVVCDDGTAMSTQNSGQRWRKVARIPNTFAISSAGGQYWIAGTQESCHGVAVQALSEDGGSVTLGKNRCAPGLDVAAGQLAIDISGGTIWLWSGNQTVVSMDDGETWK